MKKLGILLAALLLAALLGGCNSAGFGNIGRLLDDWRYKPPKTNGEASSVKPVEIVPNSGPDFTDTLGFKLENLPGQGEYTSSKFFVLDGWYAQIEFRTTDNRLLVARIAQDGGSVLAATYPEAHTASREQRVVDGVEVTVRTADTGCVMITWVRGSYQYLLHSGVLYGMPPDADIAAMVKGLTATAA